MPAPQIDRATPVCDNAPAHAGALQFQQREGSSGVETLLGRAVVLDGSLLRVVSSCACGSEIEAVCLEVLDEAVDLGVYCLQLHVRIIEHSAARRLIVERAIASRASLCHK